MKPTLLFAMLSLVFSLPRTSAMTEVETLRARCSAQEQQIRKLEEQVQSLRHTPSGTAAKETTEASPAAAASYVVRPGECIELIARKNHCAPETLAKANGLKVSSVIHPGQKLKLPGSSTAATPEQKDSQTASTPPANRTHKIQDGETYYSISKKYHVPVSTLIAANPTVKPTALRPGLVIRLSADTPASTANPQPKPAPKLASSSAPESAAPPQPSPKTTPVSAPLHSPVEPLKVAETPPAPSPHEQTPSPSNPEKKIRSVTIDGEMTYAEFAAKHGTDTGRLNDLNGLDLTSATVLAKGSELYVPAQP